MKLFFKISIATIIGALLGYAYYYFIGCSSGCAISSSPVNSTLYGAAVGLLIGIPFDKKKK